MAKKKLPSASTKRKRKSSKPGSNDSGVSLKSITNRNAETDKKIVLTDTCTAKVIDENSKSSAEVKNTPECIDKKYANEALKLVPVLDRHQLAFVEDENCLDYEPSENEDCIDENMRSKQCKINDNENAKVFPTKHAEACVNIKTVSDCELTNSIAPSLIVPDPSCSFAGSNSVSETSRYHDENMVIENNWINRLETADEILEDDFDPNEQSELDGTRLLSEEKNQDPNINLFENAKVRFNGPLNITICRNVKNYQSQVSSEKFKNSVHISNVPSVPYSTPNIKIHNVSTLIPEKNFNINKHIKKKEWPISFSEIGCPKITSADDIFSNNVDVLPKVNSKLPDEDKINSVQTRLSQDDKHSSISHISNRTINIPRNKSLIPSKHFQRNQDQVWEDSISPLRRSSISDGTVFLNRDEYELQENDKEALVAQWLMHNNKDYFYELLDSLCESHFTTGCSSLRCSKAHTLKEIEKVINQSSFQELAEYYRITLKKSLWFTWLFDIFRDRFMMVPNMGEMILINMINDVHNVFDGTLTDKTSFIIRIIEGLRKIELTFKQAIKRIILRYGTMQLWICDILLFLIAKERNLEEYWCLVQIITCCRKEKIDHKVVIELLMASLSSSPPNEQLCRMIYQYLFKKNLVDLTKIPCDLQSFISKVIGCDVGLREKILIPDIEIKCESMSSELDPSNSVVDNLQRETPSLDENSSSNLQDQDNVILEDVVVLPQDESAVHKRYVKRKQSKNPARSKSWTISSNCSSSRRVKNRVLRNAIKSLNIFPDIPQTPVNIIAHPSCQPTIDVHYKCNVSLHNLLPEVHGSLIDILTTDLHRLKKVLRDVDAVEFFDLLQRYNDPYSIESFIVNVLTLLKSIRQQSVIYMTFISLLNASETMDSDYVKETNIKVPLEVLALNLIYMMSIRGKWNLSRKILLKMKDWHNLVTSKIFLYKSNSESHMKRYIYIIKVLILAGDFSWANEIFQAEVLNLLGPSSSWPYEHKPRDIQNRNKVLEVFLDECLTKNIFIANDLLKHIVLMYRGSVDDFDLWKWFDNKILSLIEEGEGSRSVLLFLSRDISNYYEQYMDKYVLQGYMLHMVDCISTEMVLRLFKICCNKGIYHKYTGEERIVHVATNLMDVEISSILQCYFENIRVGRVCPQDFYIDLILPKIDLVQSNINERYRTSRSVHQVFETVCNILHSKFQITIDQPIQSRIVVPKSYQIHLLISN